MFIRVTKHAEKQLQIRKPGKSTGWMVRLFRSFMDCKKDGSPFLYKGVEYEVRKHYANGACKIGAYKYRFVFTKEYEEYVIITFMVKENPIWIGKNKFNLNIDSKFDN